MPTLTVITGPDAGKAFPLPDTPAVAGRSVGHPVPLTDAKVSRRHFELRPSPVGRQLFDLGSGNGTRVNGRPVQVIDLHPGDEIAVGDTVLRYSDEGGRGKAEGESDLPSPPSAFPLPPSGPRLVVRPADAVPSGVLRTVAANTGSQLLAHPDRAASDWLRTRLASLTVLYEATAAVGQILDVDELLGRIVELVLRVTDADHGCALLTDPDSGGLVPAAVRGRGGPAEFVVSRSIADHVLATGEGVLVADAATDDRFTGESIARHQLREVICVPLKGRRETVGVLFVSGSGFRVAGLGSADSGLTEDHLQLAAAVAHQAAVAVEEARAFAARVQAEKLAAVGQTIAALSHHIKNIMQGVRFGGDMVRMALPTDDKELLLKGWKLVEKNQARIDELILDMLSYSKDREPALEPTDLGALAADVAEVVRGRATDGGVSLTVTADPGLGPVNCDPDGIHRALLNVVSNALDAVDGRENPAVAVGVGRGEDGVFAEITVTDTGPGIPAEKREEIFKPFVSSKGSKGTGLGLPVSRKTLREHGGDVVIQDAAGGGTRFVLRIPLRPS